MAHIVAVSTQKGGVGKTTSTVNLADAFARRGHRILVVDMDPQSNTTTALSAVPASAIPYTTREFILDTDPATIAQCVQRSRIEGIDLVPSSIRLARAAETDMIHRNTTALSKRLKLLMDSYDIVLLDCPPNLGRLTGNALCAATHYLVPLKGGDMYSLDGIDDLEITIKDVRIDNPQLKALGVFFNMFDGRTNVSRFVANLAAERFGEMLFATRIPDAVAFQEATAMSRTVLEVQRDSSSAKAIVELGDEILGRLMLGVTK